ncbi:SDR family NAD(P)-dependent oxidoreductase [Flammeovirga agarivorans]|uniref:SDR family NAD(P)-dependent oxidoreductase n=1 Tax=Flammeovirga agarivorans TaxID=2726742 RepID=A0A7X8XUP5_9BACT|nr:SDR family NAD(P)-dependent oxidoreductase [Flammeovirga agarivorans]NLR90320.1 SDR family NAD(P)-dependent oxidoreductase [Flammeovirga agarivorans]
MKNILITGSSKGLGHGFVEYFLNQKATVYGVSRNTPNDLTGADLYHHQNIDLGNFESIESGLKELLSDVKEVDTVVLNAGLLGEIKGISDANIEEMKHLMDVNLWANKVVLDTIYGLGIDVKQVVAISSGASVNGNKGWSGYSLSKAALNMLVKLYAVEYQKTHYTALAPGLIDTGMQDYLCEKVNHEEFPSMGRLKAARGTEVMPKPKEAAENIASIFPKLLEHTSGSYQDVRKL